MFNVNEEGFCRGCIQREELISKLREEGKVIAQELLEKCGN